MAWYGWIIHGLQQGRFFFFSRLAGFLIWVFMFLIMISDCVHCFVFVLCHVFLLLRYEIRFLSPVGMEEKRTDWSICI